MRVKVTVMTETIIDTESILDPQIRHTTERLVCDPAEDSIAKLWVADWVERIIRPNRTITLKLL